MLSMPQRHELKENQAQLQAVYWSRARATPATWTVMEAQGSRAAYTYGKTIRRLCRDRRDDFCRQKLQASRSSCACLHP
ncbi:hypothetical protein BS78_05G046100 [Paspalum vaginatum]|nr:hypothetical protein BS78_05G046100 [Paspalum vaginatum]